MLKIRRFVQGAALVMGSSIASAGIITNFEDTLVDFASWWEGNTLKIEIDAAARTGGWATATHIDSIAINGPGSWTWTSVTDIQLTATGFGGPVSGTGLNASGCQGLSVGGNHQCWSGSAALADNMVFDFAFEPGIVTNFTDAPHLKVRFVDGSGRKVGSLLSEDVVTVPEPGSLALLALGLFGLGVARKRLT